MHRTPFWSGGVVTCTLAEAALQKLGLANNFGVHADLRP